MELVLCQHTGRAGHCPLHRCACPDVPNGVLILEGLTYIGTHRLQLLFSMMGNVALGAASEAEQVLGLSHVAHSSGSSANMLYITTRVWGPNFYLLPFLLLMQVWEHFEYDGLVINN